LTFRSILAARSRLVSLPSPDISPGCRAHSPAAAQPESWPGCTRESCQANQHVLVWAAHDGIETQTSGIAVLTGYFAHDAAELRARLEDSPRSRSAAYIAYPATGRPSVRGRISSAHGRPVGLIPLASPVPDDNPFGNSTVWGSWCAQLAQWARSIESPGTHTIVIANDTPFFGMARALRTAGARRTDCVTVVHSIARIWDPALGVAEERRRDEWEKHGLQAAISQRMPVIAVSQHVKSRLVGHFALPPSAIVVQPPRHSAAALAALVSSQEAADAWLDAEGIPPGTQVVLWSGRDVEAKAPDVARRAFADLIDDSPSLHALMFLRDDLSRPADRSNPAGRSGRLRIYHDFPFTLPRQLLATARVQCVLVSSRSEPHGLIPEESIILGTLAGTAITPAVSRAGGLRDQEQMLRKGAEFYDDPESASAAAAALSQALSTARAGTPVSEQLQAYRRFRAAGTFTDWIFALLDRLESQEHR
jgi:hypothetical protein